jgi:Domain of unknown function (DUF1843)
MSKTAREGGGPVPPYGTAIRDAIARGNLQELKAVAEAARRSLYDVKFAKTTDAKATEVRDALQELEEAIQNIEQS